ncbi:hypothetical protein ACFL4L_01735 [bacterium]
MPNNTPYHPCIHSAIRIQKIRLSTVTDKDLKDEKNLNVGDFSPPCGRLQ